MKSLDVNIDDKIEITYCELPKATYISLDCTTESEYSQSEIQVAIQQYFRNNFTTLDENEKFQMIYNDKTFDIIVTKLEPSSSVLIIDIDCELDLHYKQIQQFQDNSNTVSVGKVIDGSIVKDEYKQYIFNITPDTPKFVDIEYNV